MSEIQSFQRRLNLFDSTAIVVGSMIGSGIFIVSADIARMVGSSGWLMMVWIISGFMTLIAALSYGELAGMFPKAGGQYIYLKEAYNPLTGFLYGWTLFLVIQTGTIAAVAMAFAKFTGVLFPWVSESVVWFDLESIRFGEFDAGLFRVGPMNLGFVKFGPAQLVAIGSIALLTWINSRGIKSGKKVQNLFTSGKFILLAAFIVVGLVMASNLNSIRINSPDFWNPMREGPGGVDIPLSGMTLLAALGMAMVGGLFSSDAWNNITFTAGEVINPRKNIPLSLFLGTLIVTILYLLANVVYITALPVKGDPGGTDIASRGMQYALNDRLGTAALSGIFGNYAVIIMAVFIVISTFGCNNGLILSGARVYYAMADDGIFFKGVGRLNKKDVPATGLLFQGVWASLLCLSGTYGQLLDYVVFAVLIFYVLTILGIFILRVSRPDLSRPYKAFGYPIIPMIYIILALVIMVILFIFKREYTWPGLIIVILGIPVYFIWATRKKTDQTMNQESS
ncbi:MAG TPA: amino acid permease [Bacteroidales bacterium]|nr:amino acid permease [Bacteroidales bacterium]HPS51070.1 amino acid permease [Bacteroidales bacterium]